MRKPMIAGNWKMNKTVSEAETLVNTIKAGVHQVTGVDIVICPTAVCLDSVGKLLDRSNIELGAQNMYCAADGAFTGEIAPGMLKEVKCRYVILGHSERRTIFGETDELINKKVKLALEYNLVPILCIGETLEEREKGITEDVVKKQLAGSLAGLSADDMSSVVLAYEPVWAIGTGKTASPEQAEEVHKSIREYLESEYGTGVSSHTRILYGGSVKPDNVAELMKKENIDGGLIGGAALKGESFIQLVQYTKEVIDANN